VLPLRRYGELQPDAPALIPGALPPGATYDDASGELRWTPTLGQAGEYQIPVVTGTEAVELIEIGVLDRFDDPSNVPIADPALYTREYGLPVFHLSTAWNINDDDYTPAQLVYRGYRFADVQAKYRGATSRKYPKRSFTLKFAKSDPFVEEAHDFHGARRVVLTSTFDDNSYLRQRLAFTLWNRMAPAVLPIANYTAVVFLDGEYQGVYTVTDHIDDDYLGQVGESKDGNLYKGRTHDANFRLTTAKGRDKANLHVGYTKEEGLPEAEQPGAFDDLDELVRWIATADDESFAAELDTRLVRSDFEGWLMLCATIAANDSTDKNSYLHHDPWASGDAARWRFFPWDFNASFGQDYSTRRLPIEAYTLDDLGRNNELFDRLLNDPQLRAALVERYRELLQTRWSLDSVLRTWDDWVREIAPSALRDERKWGQAYREFKWTTRKDAPEDYNDARGELDYVRSWIEQRWQHVAGLL
jgi:spore coat protein H